MYNMIVPGNRAKWRLQNLVDTLLMIQKQAAHLLVYLAAARFSS